MGLTRHRSCRKELNNNLLGSKAEGAFSAGSNPNTKYVTFNLTRDLINNWQLTTSYSEGKTNISGNQIGDEAKQIIKDACQAAGVKLFI